MYLLRDKWTRSEAILFAALVSFIPWGFLLVLVHLLSRDQLSLEVGIVASGFLALLFAGLLSALLFSLGQIIPDVAFFLRKILTLFLLLSPVAIGLTAFFPLNLFLVSALAFFLLLRLAPSWQQDPPEDSVRLEPVFFLTVGFKVVVIALFLSYVLL